MKPVKLLTMLCLFLGLTGFVKAQNTTADMVKEWERAKAYTKEYLDVMPDDKYNLKPTPESRSFADQMLHLADANYGLTAVATGDKSPFELGALEKSADKTKAAVTKAVMDSYDFVINIIKKFPVEKYSEQIKVFGKFDMSRGMALAKSFEHQTHHRGQTTVYIRLAGAKPPQEMLF
ncbi:MAG: damage-inducible protein DinB [Sphingobacteriaceae bacterium]|nr:MAG: damage-inducible protein DinB [Sphingobacteriaceae bacterium]